MAPADTPTAITKINFVRILPGQALTVYAQQSMDDPNAIQIEIRVKPDGVIEIFTDETISVEAFSVWEPMS